MAKVIFKNEYKLNFYPGAGVNKYEKPFRLYLAWDKKFITLFDSDEGGKEAKKDYIKKIGPDVENKIFTFEDIKSEWKKLEIEDIFSEQEKIQIIQSYFKEETRYVKSKFNTAIQGLYIQKKDFDISQETLNKFRGIFDFLQKKIN